MKVLIAGKGFIGSSIGEKLEEDGHEVKYLDREDADYNVDVTESFEIEEKFDVLYHTIGLAPGFASEEMYEEIHVDGTENLMDGVKADRVVYLSALKVDEVNHPFFNTKQEAENIIEESVESFTHVQPSTVYGRGNKLLDMMRSLSWTRVFPNIKTETQPIRIEDLVDVLVECLELDQEIVRAAGPEKMTIGQLGKKIYSEEGRRCLLLPAPQALLEWSLIGLDVLPPPFDRKNIAILQHSNSTDENDAEDLVELGAI